MITLTAEVICDRCKTPIACGEPTEHWREAVASAVALAKARGAIVGLRARCRDCDIIEQARNPKSPPSPPPHQVPIDDALAGEVFVFSKTGVSKINVEPQTRTTYQDVDVLPCGCLRKNRDLCPHGNSPLA